MVIFLRKLVLFLFKSVNLIPVAIFIAKAWEIKFRSQGMVFTLIDNNGNPTFLSNFIEWFGVLYGILLPLILVRVWEQLDAIDREFDREADAVRLLYEDIYYLPGNSAKFAKETAKLLRNYVVHIIENYRYEIKSPTHLEDDSPNNNENGVFEQAILRITSLYKLLRNNLYQFLYPEIINVNPEIVRAQGDDYLQKIRAHYKELIFNQRKIEKEPDPFVTEIFQRLNDIVDIRGDRISLASERLFESLRLVALIASITFVVPFYFVSFSSSTPPLDKLLVIAVTLLVVFMYLIVDDFDEPFGGTWRITDDSWRRVLRYIDSTEAVNKKKNGYIKSKPTKRRK